MIGIVGKSTDSPNDRCLHFEIGDIGVSVRSEVPALLEDLTALYPGRRPSAPAPDRTIHMEVREARRSTLGCRRYRVYGDGEQIGAEHQHQELLPFVEWGINWRVIATRAEYLQVHAATMVHSGRGFLFAGGSGSGKSTLVAGLLARGWRYLCDEFALIDPGTLHLHPFPKAVCIKAGSFDIVEYLKLPLARRRYYIKGLKGRVGYINPRDVGSDIVGGPSPVRFVIFPKYIAGGKPDLYPISRARAAFALSGCALNRNAFGNRAISILANVVRGAECFSLETGPIDKTCDLVESLLAGVRPGSGIHRPGQSPGSQQTSSAASP